MGTSGLKYKGEHHLRPRWRRMKSRCQNPKSHDYKHYGGRGIDLCERWEYFDNFLLDMEPTFMPGLTLDRIDNNLGYSPDNCRWATRFEQQKNTRRTRWFTIKGSTRTRNDWIKLSGLNRSTVDQRYYVYGWSIEKALGMEA